MIQTRGLSKSFTEPSGRARMVLSDVDLDVAPGEAVALMGRSGVGKSTLLHLLGLLDSPSSGTYRLDGHDVQDLDDRSRSRLRSQHVGFVFQHFNLLPRRTAMRNVETAGLVAGLDRAQVTRTAATLLDAMGLADRLDDPVEVLSGGEKQRVAMARCLLTSPSVILADEPTGSLDLSTGAGILDVLLQPDLRGHRSVVVLVTHDPVVAKRCDRVLDVASWSPANASSAHSS